MILLFIASLKRILKINLPRLMEILTGGSTLWECSPAVGGVQVAVVSAPTDQ